MARPKHIWVPAIAERIDDDNPGDVEQRPIKRTNTAEDFAALLYRLKSSKK